VQFDGRRLRTHRHVESDAQLGGSTRRNLQDCRFVVHSQCGHTQRGVPVASRVDQLLIAEDERMRLVSVVGDGESRKEVNALGRGFGLDAGLLQIRDDELKLSVVDGVASAGREVAG